MRCSKPRRHRGGRPQRKPQAPDTQHCCTHRSRKEKQGDFYARAAIECVLVQQAHALQSASVRTTPSCTVGPLLRPLQGSCKELSNLEFQSAQECRKRTLVGQNWWYVVKFDWRKRNKYNYLRISEYRFEIFSLFLKSPLRSEPIVLLFHSWAGRNLYLILLYFNPFVECIIQPSLRCRIKN